MLTVASLGIFAVLAACALGTGFMVRFLVAISRDENQIRVAHPVRARGVSSDAAVNPAGHLAMGVCESQPLSPRMPGNTRRRNGPISSLFPRDRRNARPRPYAVIARTEYRLESGTCETLFLWRLRLPSF